MKPSHYLRLFLLVCIAPAAQVVQAQNAKDEIQIIQGMYGLEKKEIITRAMDLSDIEAAKFWPVYDAYETARKKLGGERLEIIADYVSHYNGLTDAKADELAGRIFKNDLSFDKLHKTYYKKMKGALSPLRAAQFMQVESFLQNSIRLFVAQELPFIGEFKK